ncbi:MAG: S9 family peptidase [Gammaproteobacteria bacterium]|nr:S9 family peptidase [Gammaproteobacteria bacterium]
MSKLFYNNSIGLYSTESENSAQSAPKLPGDTSLPTSEADLVKLGELETGTYSYAVEDFFTKPAASAFQLSPNGRYLSFKKRNDQGKTDLWLQDTETQEERMLLAEGDEVIRGYGWLTDERLVYMKDKGGDENYHIFAIDADGNNDKDLTPYDGVMAQIQNLLKDDPEHIIILMNKDNPQLFEPYRLNVATADIEKLYTNDDMTQPIAGYDIDKDGNLRGFTRIVDGVNQHQYYMIDGQYTKIKEVVFGEDFNIIGFDYQSENPDAAYVLTNLTSDKAEIQHVDLKTGEVFDTVFTNDTYDVSGMRRSRARAYEIDYFGYEGERNVTHPVSETFNTWYTNLRAHFSEYGDAIDIDIADATDDESKLLVTINSDKIIGRYYLYTPATNELTLLHELLPNLKADGMATMMPIQFQSRDGLTIHGYFTRPAGSSDSEKLPVVVNPHGGPQGIRDSWGFNPEAQLFASRGYATLHVNFRVSGGYGKDFLQKGFGQIGRKAMDDVEDGLQYLIDQGWVDAEKVAIYGGSHGGYAVLRGLTKTPDLYACGVDYVGVANLFTFMNTMPPYWEPYRKMVETIWYDPADESQQEIMNEVSPAMHTDKITKPLFVVQGANDPRVNINEADQIVSALRERGVDVPYMVKYDEGHGFAKESNRLDLYRAMMGFFAQYLK